jgi:hypothetical protein
MFGKAAVAGSDLPSLFGLTPEDTRLALGKIDLHVSRVIFLLGLHTDTSTTILAESFPTIWGRRTG